MNKYYNGIMLFFILGFLADPCPGLFAQNPQLQVLTSGTNTNLRGLSVVNDNIIWVSGSNATVGKSLNGGKTWNWMVVKGFEKKEFRDIEAFDANTAIIMAVDSPAYILKTTNGGDTWKVVYENRNKGMFLDAMDFSDRANGIVIGDPINNKAFVAFTSDNGSTWKELSDRDNNLRTETGEAFFAASGSNVRVFRNGDYFMVSGGTRSRLMSNEGTVPLAMTQGKESTGANAIDFFDGGNPERPGKRMVIVGGDFNAPDSTKGNCLYTTNGKDWKSPKTPPHGYRSSVEYLDQKNLIACGLNGIDYSRDGGKTWRLISREGFHVGRIARIGYAFFLAGANGRVARLNWD